MIQTFMCSLSVVFFRPLQAVNAQVTHTYVPSKKVLAVTISEKEEMNLKESG